MLALGLSASRKFRQVRMFAKFESDKIHLDFPKIIISNLSAAELCRSGGCWNLKRMIRKNDALCFRRCHHRSVYSTLQAFSSPVFMTVGGVLNPDWAGPKWKRSRGLTWQVGVNCQTFLPARYRRLYARVIGTVISNSSQVTI